MKKQLFKSVWTMMLMASVAIFASSCEDEVETIPQLPNMVVIECKAGDHPDFVFTANGNWRLSSDKKWCKFQTSGGNLLDISGRAGTHKITLIIGNEDIRNQVTTAKITIIMGSHKATIAEVKRAPDSLYLNIYNIANEPIKSVTIGYNGYTPMLVEANFKFYASEYPEWVEIRDGGITGEAEEQSEAYLRIRNNGDRERWPIKVEDGYTIVFSDLEGENTFSFPIVYNGMGEFEIITEGPTSNEFGWEVTPDGKVFSQQNDDGTTSQFENELKYNIVAHLDTYRILYLERVVERGIPRYNTYTESSKCWMHFDKETQTLTVDPTDELRYGQVMVFPTGIYNLILSDLENGILFEMDNSSGIDLPTLKPDYQKYVLTDLTQRGTKEADILTEMHIYHSITAFDIPAKRYYNSDITDKYGVSEAYIAPFVNSIPGKIPSIVINPRIEGWNTANYDTGIASAEVWYKDELLKVSDKEYYIGENVDELLSLELSGPKEGFEIGGENIYIVFKVNNEAKKLLVVTPPTE